MSRKKLMREKIGRSCRTGLGRSWRARMRGLAGIGAGQGWGVCGGGECELLRKNVRRNMQLRSCLQRKKPNIFHEFFLGGTG